jgi:hypothetical protein
MKKAIIIITIFVVGAGAAWFFVNDEESIIIPSTNVDERFGFLIGPSSKEIQEVRDIGAGWIRPHPGPFIWGSMQNGSGDGYNFKESDEIVKDAEKYSVRVLATLWPYADWDQVRHSSDKVCKIKGDEFSREFGNFRCNPYEWKAYKGWVSAVVERYDGDGVNDMPGLLSPITHWEVFNEPDLSYNQQFEDFGLKFYTEGPAEYVELLKYTHEAIVAADPNAIVLIAGAASGEDMHLSFYEEVFADESVSDYFDIANIHCISSGDIGSFNVEPYKQLLSQFGISKPIWVTEAEALVGSDSAKNATQIKLSTEKALELGAEKIFFVSRDINNSPGGDKHFDNKEKVEIKIDPTLKGSSKEIYQTIFESL